VIAEALFDLEMYAEACEELQPCLSIDSVSPSAHMILGKCLCGMGQDLDALAAFRAVGLRRTVPAPAKLRAVAMRLALEIAERYQLSLSAERYRHAIEIAETELAK
jgi:tetratricopeptide (TPR) repeat protein